MKLGNSCGDVDSKEDIKPLCRHREDVTSLPHGVISYLGHLILVYLFVVLPLVAWRIQ